MVQNLIIDDLTKDSKEEPKPDHLGGKIGLEKASKEIESATVKQRDSLQQPIEVECLDKDE